MRADRHHPGHRQVDLAEQDDQHHAGGDDAEERGDLELLQQIFRRQEAARIEAAEEQQQQDAGEGGQRPPGRRGAGSSGRRPRDGRSVGVAHPNQSSRLRTRNRREGAEADGEQQHDALEQRLPQRVEVEDEEQVADGAEGERAEDRADGAAPAAEQRHAAEHHRGDREERVGVAAGDRPPRRYR